MALLRFISFPSPSSSLFSNQTQTQTQTQNPQFLNHINPNNSLSLSLFHNRFSKKSKFLIFQTHSAIEATQAQAENSTEEIQQVSDTRLLAQNVPWTCTEDDIRPLFEKYGTIVDIEVSMYSRTKNRGLVFVTMSSHEEALAAFTNLQSYEFMGRTLNMTWAYPKKISTSSSPTQPKPAPVHNLFVANLPFQARSKDLMEFFSAENSNVVSAEVIFKEKPRGSTGYGFVSFNSKQEAEAALTAFQGKVFMGRAIRVSPSKKFLRQSTKKVIETKDESSTSETEGEQAQTTEAEA